MDKFSRFEQILQTPEHYSRHFTRKVGDTNVGGVRCTHCEKATTEHYVTTPPYTNILCMDCFWRAKALYEWASKAKVGKDVGTLISKFSGLVSTRTSLSSSNRFTVPRSSYSSQQTSSATSSAFSNAAEAKKRLRVDEDEEEVETDSENDAVMKAVQKKSKSTTSTTETKKSHQDAVKAINSYVDSISKEIKGLRSESVVKPIPVYEETAEFGAFAKNPLLRTFVFSTSTGKKIEIKENSSDKFKTVGDLMERLFVTESIPIEHQRIIYQGKFADKAKTLAECGISDGAILGLVLNTTGH